MTKLPKFLAVAALLAGCGDYARTGNSPADVFYFPTGIAVGHRPTSCLRGTPGCPDTCQGGAPDCQTVLYVASSNFDLRYDLATGGALTAVDVATSKRIGDPIRMGSFAGDLALVDGDSCTGWTGDPTLLVSSRSANTIYGMAVAADGSLRPDAVSTVPLDLHLRDPFALALACRGAGGLTAWVSFLTSYQTLGWVQPVKLASVSPGTAPSLQPDSIENLAFSLPAQAMAYDRNSDRIYFVSTFSGATASLYYADVRHTGGAGSRGLTVPGEATGLAVSADGTRAYVALRLFNSLVASSGSRPADVGGALAVVDLTEQPGGGPAGTLLRLVPIGLGPSYVRAVDRRGLGLRDLVAVTCTADSTFHLYDDEVGAVVNVVGADDRGTPRLGKRIYGLAVESPYYRSAAAPTAVRFFVASFEDGKVSTVVVDDPAAPGADTGAPTAVITPGNP